MSVDDAIYVKARRRLIDTIVSEARESASWTGRSAFSSPVIAAMANIPRHRFVRLPERPFAYANRPLDIGHGQTISQPYIVAAMTDLLDLTDTDRVLEIGTGCGYQTAVLAHLVSRVHSVEVIPDLAKATAGRLADLGHTNVEIHVGDGWQGWAEAAPFDAIIVTAAASEMPSRLTEQLRPGGRIVIPIGPAGDTQWLFRGVRQDDGTLDLQRTLPVAFVPMVHADYPPAP